MNKKRITKITTYALILVMVASMLLTATMPTFGQGNTSDASFVQQLGSINTNYQQYLDSSVVTKLPDSVKDTDEISVIVSLDTPALLDAYNKTDKKLTFAQFTATDEAKAVLDTISTKKIEALKSLNATSVDFVTGEHYDSVLSGFEIVIKAKDFETVCAALGESAMAIVGEVYNVAETTLVENKVNIYEETGIFDSSDFKYDGTGMVVAVLDTGLDYTHSAFSAANFNVDKDKLGLTKDMVASLIEKTRAAQLVKGLTADDVYLNDGKVPFSFDYADSDADVYSLHNNHGTHVSGVITGNDDVITGVAPNAQLISMKIFSDVQDSARTSWIISALEDCVVLGVDVINMSLGTACGFSREMDREAINGNVYQKIRDAGISMVVAASNSYSSAYGSDKNGNLGLTTNPDTSTVGSPSTYEGAMSVASINGKKTPYLLYNGKIIYFVEATDSAAEEKEFVNEILPEGINEKEFEYVTIPGAGRFADYTGIDVTGKIVLVRRGSNTFEEKANAAQKAGAAGIIIYNNVSGDIKMNAGITTIPIISISQDDGEELAAAGKGTIKISRSQSSGPFISDFSSWGPSPDLGIKPEITAHGGNILSAITGGGYDRLSGTSMACPNMAGVTILLRQYVVDEFPEIANDPVKVAALVNCLSMSTADVIYNKNGLPYAVRKQGAGLANLVSASTTKAYIMTYDRVDGSVMDKSKIELGDDPDKTGVYTLKFSVNNFGDVALKYELSAHVITEGVSDTKTNDGATTVTEEGYALTGAVCQVVAVTGGGSSSGNTITVEPNSIAHVEYKITLSEEDKKYLDSSFKNGMYVEGFVNLNAVSGTEVDLSVPYLAFYGDWTVAPIFDLDYYETNKDELDDGISEEDKTKADAYATRPIGGVSSDFVSYLGSYYFLQNPENKVISASRDYVAISNVEGTIHKLRFVWAGLLRNAERIEITIVDTSTGEEIFKTVDDDVRKSYGDGGSIYPANVEIEFDAAEYNLKNNTQYNVKLQAFLDYGDGGVDTNLKNTFEFPLYADFEAPAVTGCEFYTEYDKTLKKNRLFARIAIYDNHYAMAMQVGYVGIDPESTAQSPSYLLNAFESYLTPVYSQRNSTTYVEYELTDFVHEIKEGSVHKNSFTVATYDYALNEATYEISLPAEYIDLYFEEESVTLSPNQTYNLNPLVYPTVSWGELLDYTSSNQKVARVVKNQIIAVGTGSARIYAQDPKTGKYDFIDVTVLGEGDEGFKRVDKPVVQRFELTGYETLKAFYYLNNDDRDIGTTGEIIKFVSENYALSMFPSEAVKLDYVLDAYFPNDTEVVFESNNESIVKVDQNGNIVAVGEGFSSVTIRVLLDGNSTFYSETVSISVKDPFIRSGPQLTHYFGNGGVVNIPASLLITEIGSYAFSNFDYIPKDENDEISDEDPDTTKQWFLGEATVEKVIIPEGVKKIGPYAFANLTALREVVLPTTLEAIEYGAFFNCTSLEKVTGIENVELINYAAFENCNLKGTISLNDAKAIGDNVFRGNRRLEGVILPEALQSIGARAFEGDISLKSVTIKASQVKYGPYVFSGCSALENMEINTSVIPAGAFSGAKSLTSITIGKDVNVIGEYAFANAAVSSFTVKEGNKAFKAQESGSYILSKDEKTLVLVAPSCEGEFTLDGVTSVANGAFSSTLRVTTVNLKDVTSVGNYAFADCERITSINLGALTYIGEYAFSGTSITTLPSFDKVSSIGNYAFAYTDITEVTIPDGMKIGEGAFCECGSLKTVNIGDNVTIGTGAFMLGRGENNRVSFYEQGGKKFYYFIYTSPLETLVIGDNAVIGDSAFMGAAEIKQITLGEGAVIGNMSFYNCCALENVINLDKAVSIGSSAFSGDVLYEYATSEMTTLAVYNNAYLFRYYAPALKNIDISAATEIGQGAFQYCMSLESVVIGDELKVIPMLAFANCSKLSEINLDGVVTVETNAFAEADLRSVDLSSAEVVYEYAFVYNENLKDVILNENGTSLKEGAFAYCTPLKTPENIEKSSEIGAYSFAYTAIDKVDLSSAVTIGDHAFLKERLTPFEVKLGSVLEKLGDNPFAYCILKPFESKVSEEFNGVTYESVTYDFDISETVKVVDGSLYCKVPNGYELITFCGKERANVKVADGTVRIAAYAFAGSDVVRVILPHTVRAIGHKAMFDCNRLATVVFGSYNAPILEEEMDMEYYNSYEHIPATGEYEFQDGSVRVGIELVPYYMWNATSYKYVDCYYGASFVDYIGHVEKPIVMVRPTNGQYYDTFIYNQYFSVVIDGTVAPKDETLLAIEAIEKLPNPVKLTDEALVIAARLAYDKIATKDQQALVTNFAKLVTAENRILALKSALEEDEPQIPNDSIVDNRKDGAKTVLTVFVIIESVIIVLLAGAVVTYVILKKKGISVRALAKKLLKKGTKKTGGEK